ncbi:MAG: hypothetical protein HQ581_04075 [Planctomycetes bacterium]|nr:hypothetical protein [Planctomycetota bacterium]
MSAQSPNTTSPIRQAFGICLLLVLLAMCFLIFGSRFGWIDPSALGIPWLDFGAEIEPPGASPAEQAARERLEEKGRYSEEGCLIAAEMSSEDKDGNKIFGHVTSVNVRGRGEKPDDQLINDLAALPKVVHIDLGNTQVTTEQLAQLTGLSELASLVLSNTPTDDDGLAHVAEIKDVEALHLVGCTGVTNEGLVHLKKMPLKVLDLSRTSVDDEGLKHLADFDEVHWLLLRDNKITDAGIQHLATMDNLRRLTVDGTAVTSEGVRELKESVEGLAVDHGPGAPPPAEEPPQEPGDPATSQDAAESPE